jgi:hypothetical protein
MFFPLMLVCSAMDTQDCDIVTGNFFPTYEECVTDMTTNGMLYVNLVYGRNIHIGFMECMEADVLGEPV